MDLVDLRSDTVTQPSEAMRRVMAQAEVGDDVFGEDPSVNALQEYVADLLGKEAALFVPSGVMGNQIALAVHCRPGDEVIVEAASHIFTYETAAPALIARVQLFCIPSAQGQMPLEALERAIRPPEYYFPRTALICLENTHNRHGGTVLPIEYIHGVAAIARRYKLALHGDGARLWNACAASGITPRQYAEPFDSVMISFSKGLGAPVGSALAGSRDFIAAARKWRKILGGGMRQAGILAAAALYALQHHRERLREDHEHARLFAQLLVESAVVELELERVQTNIVVFRYPSHVPFAAFAEVCRREGVLLSQGMPGFARAVFHLDVSRQQTIQAAKGVIRAVRSLL
ncbi:MAG: low-specificity L-threonine aldolase [Candidatus Kapabacteria bacterium]|nr:low-specificity L-threonine aldolase [Candidatus Kapabacteria bacterium]MDW7996053.1 low-specificity L-threonine aldolase [Bacteroidota bacterium]MDW8224513.1 low-specificity L-threonine aldolase [Bacteroidota bacterium]